MEGHEQLRQDADGAPVIELLGLRIHPERYQIEVDGDFVELTPVEMATLLLLARRPERVFTFDDILDTYHGGYHEVTPQAVKGVIYRLRQKMGRYRHLIRPVRGVGYVIRLRNESRFRALAWPVVAFVAVWDRMTTPARAGVAVAGAVAMTITAGTAAGLIDRGSAAPSSLVGPILFLGVTETGSTPEQAALAQRLGLPTPPILEHGIGTSVCFIDSDEIVTVAHPHPEEGWAPSRLHRLHFARHDDRLLGVVPLSSHRLRDGVGVVRPFASINDRFGPASRIPPSSAVRVLPDRSIVAISPTGDAMLHLSRDGRHLHTWHVPSQMLTGGASTDHLAPRAIENLAVTPGGRVLAIGRTAPADSLNLPLLVLDPARPDEVRLWQLALNAGDSVHDLLTVDDTAAFVLVRRHDGPHVTHQALHRIDLSDDPARVVLGDPVVDFRRALPRDLRDHRIEGVALGPTMPDGRRLLLALDDRAHLRQSNRLYAFSLDSSLFTPSVEAKDAGD